MFSKKFASLGLATALLFSCTAVSSAQTEGKPVDQNSKLYTVAQKLGIDTTDMAKKDVKELVKEKKAEKKAAKDQKREVRVAKQAEKQAKHADKQAAKAAKQAGQTL